MAGVNPKFWQGKRVFLTGHTGFKGSWMGAWLTRLGAHVTGFRLRRRQSRATSRCCRRNTKVNGFGNRQSEESMNAQPGKPRMLIFALRISSVMPFSGVALPARRTAQPARRSECTRVRAGRAAKASISSS